MTTASAIPQQRVAPPASVPSASVAAASVAVALVGGPPFAPPAALPSFDGVVAPVPAGPPAEHTWMDELVADAVRGDERARERLLGVIHPLVLRYCRARLGRQEAVIGSADDVAQDVCMAVVSALPSYELKGLSFRAFVYGIAAHKVTDTFRAIGRNRSEPVAEIPDAPVTNGGPESSLLAAELSERLGDLLHILTPRQREVLVLRIGVGLSAEETAQAVRSTPGAVRVTQHRALGRLRKVMLGEAVADETAAADDADDDEGGPVVPSQRAKS